MLDSSKVILAACMGLFESTEPATGLAAARPVRSQRHYIEMLIAIPMPGYLLSYM
jgi:hypothetical protein